MVGFKVIVAVLVCCAVSNAFPSPDEASPAAVEHQEHAEAEKHEADQPAGVTAKHEVEKKPEEKQSGDSALVNVGSKKTSPKKQEHRKKSEQTNSVQCAFDRVIKEHYHDCIDPVIERYRSSHTYKTNHSEEKYDITSQKDNINLAELVMSLPDEVGPLAAMNLCIVGQTLDILGTLNATHKGLEHIDPIYITKTLSYTLETIPFLVDRLLHKCGPLVFKRDCKLIGSIGCFYDELDKHCHKD
jgi:hypothetical protein